MSANLSNSRALVGWLWQRLLRLKVQCDRHAVLAELDAVGYLTVAFAFHHSMRMAQANGVMTTVLYDRVGGRVRHDDVTNTILFEAMQPLSKGA